MSIFNRSNEEDFSRGTKTLIIYPNVHNDRNPQARLEEAQGLALAIGLLVVDTQHLRVRKANAATLVGGGQTREIKEFVENEEIELVYFDASLSAIQQRNLEEIIKAKIIDRTGLILEIFGERASTAEGRLQVELAHLDYQQGRLVRSWTHLERQRGGFGFLGGPGETQIESDRRMIRDRMSKLRKELDQVKRTRGLHRARREKAPWPVIALVGYTNAGKSTLFNRLTGSDIFAENLLFATLDPTMRDISLPGVSKAILSDTVGFVSDLPTQLVAAFRATLEEVIAADIIVHVRDIAHPNSAKQKSDVINILRSLGLTSQADYENDGMIIEELAWSSIEEEQFAETEEIIKQTPIIEVWNKSDLLNEGDYNEFHNKSENNDFFALISAHNGHGIDSLKDKLSHLILRNNHIKNISINVTNGALLAWVHRNSEILSQIQNETVIDMQISMNEQQWGQYLKKLENSNP